MEKRKTGLTMIQCRVETRALLKLMAKDSCKTIPDFLAEWVEHVAAGKGLALPDKYKAQESTDMKILKGDFTETGKGVIKHDTAFRRLKDCPKDEEKWEHMLKDGTAQAYVDWYEKEFGIPWKGALEFGGYKHG